MGKKVLVDVTELGRAGGKATAAGRTAAERRAASKHAITARWAAYYKLHPEKLKAKLEKVKKAKAKKAGK